jgi:DNA-binding transcriptional regulator YiaG
MKANKQPTAAQRWQTQRTMTPAEFRSACFALGMKISPAARYLGISNRTARRYLSGHTTIPTAVALLFCSMLHHGDIPYQPRHGEK